jgi:hypothetical protein
MRGEIRLIRGLRLASTLGLLVALLLLVNGVFVQSEGAAVAVRVVGGLVLAAVAFAVRRIAERRAATVNERARLTVSDTPDENELALTLRSMAPAPADDRYVRRRKEKDTAAFVRTLDFVDTLEAAGALARMIDPATAATPKERERLLSLQAGLAPGQDPALAGLRPEDIVVLAAMAADPDRAAGRA